MKVMIHAHTTFSADGELTPGELGALARSRGFDAILVSDHFESLTPGKFDQLLHACRNVASCLMIAGYERSFSGYHILALGVDRWFDERDVAQWAADVRGAGGLVAAAHPSRYGHDIPQHILSACDAVEVWNSKFAYDGQVCPNPRAYSLLEARRRPLCSQDLHGVRHLSSVGIEIDRTCRTSAEILNCIRAGEYWMTNGVLSFDAQPPALAGPLLAAFHRARRSAVNAAIRVRREIRTRSKGRKT